jgi:zinc/manganese transport system permease protein
MNAEMLQLLTWPLMASLLLPWLLVYLGLHIVRRGVIFVDLALAQIAAFGTCAALLVGYDVHDWQSFPFSLGFTFVGAVLLTFTRVRRVAVPQEALIGIIYVVAAAATILALSKIPGGKEELQRSLVGELLVVPPAEVMKTFVLYLLIGAVHFGFRRQFSAISEDHAAAEKSGLRVRWWDFLFYILFGLVVTSFVHIGGVLLAFSYLVIPAVCAAFLVGSMKARFVLGWVIATMASIASLLVTARLDLPIGAATVCVLGIALLICIGLSARFVTQPRGQGVPRGTSLKGSFGAEKNP